MKTENEILAGHLRDLAERSFDNSMYTFTHFLDESQIGQLMTMEKELAYVGLSLFGGTEHADRCVARFGKEENLGYSEPFPIACIQISPVVEKFAQPLSHRDFLGALMSLGVERDLLGDIYVHEKTAIVFCMDHIAGYIKQNLDKVRNTNVTVSVLEEVPDIAGPNLENRTIITSSERLDAVVSRIYNLSRSQSLSLIAQGKICVNAKPVLNNSLSCRPADKISVRGYGKFIFDGPEGTTGKGRLRIRVHVYK